MGQTPGSDPFSLSTGELGKGVPLHELQQNRAGHNDTDNREDAEKKREKHF